MEKEFIPYEQAFELRKLGFDEECLTYYLKGIDNEYYLDFSFDYDYTNSHWMFNANDGKDRDKMCTAPLYQQAFRWFREKHNCNQYIQKFEDTFFLCVKNNDKFWTADRYDLYEEAELACLKKLIEIVKNNK